MKNALTRLVDPNLLFHLCGHSFGSESNAGVYDYNCLLSVAFISFLFCLPKTALFFASYSFLKFNTLSRREATPTSPHEGLKPLDAGTHISRVECRRRRLSISCRLSPVGRPPCEVDMRKCSGAPCQGVFQSSKIIINDDTTLCTNGNRSFCKIIKLTLE